MKILCKFHDDKNPSMKLYDNGYFCFVCGAHGSLDSLKLDSTLLKDLNKKKEDVQAKISYIEQLPKKEFRGLIFPYDYDGFYIVWPDNSYYLLRAMSENFTVKYKGPAGVQRPLLWARKDRNTILAVVEGEINALTLSHCVEHIDVVSPGSATEFPKLENYLHLLRGYAIILLMADNDKAGVTALINTAKILNEDGSRYYAVPMGHDVNEIFLRYGQKAVEQRVKKEIGRALAKGAP